MKSFLLTCPSEIHVATDADGLILGCGDTAEDALADAGLIGLTLTVRKASEGVITLEAPGREVWLVCDNQQTREI